MQNKPTRTFVRCARDQFSKPGIRTLLSLRKAHLHKSHTWGPFGRSFQSRQYVTANPSPSPKRPKSDLNSSTPSDIQDELARAAQVLESSSVPSEVAILQALHICQNLARNLVGSTGSSDVPGSLEKTPTSNLLNLDEHETKPPKPPKQLPLSLQTSGQKSVSDTAYQIVTDAGVFMTPAILATYVDTQSLLRRPHSFPQIFDLYAAKPIPRPGSAPLTYTDPNPNSHKAAIPLQTSNTALEAALKSKDLALCLSVITTTVGTSAFRRAKFVRKALLPTTAFALSPIAAYLLGKAFSECQERLDPTYATYMGTAAIMTYFAMTTLTGYIAITTANDQMDRVTWRVGTPLNQRWLREEERAFTDKVAQAWGFQDYLKRGEEEGPEWSNLRDWIMERNMDLDKPELMEGMQ